MTHNGRWLDLRSATRCSASPPPALKKGTGSGLRFSFGSRHLSTIPHRERRAQIPHSPFCCPRVPRKYIRGMLVTLIEGVIKNRPGLTAKQIAEAIAGPAGYGEWVRPACRILVARGIVILRGTGGPADPFRYYPLSAAGQTAGSDMLSTRASTEAPYPLDATPRAR